jgi:hypothetical protein
MEFGMKQPNSFNSSSNVEWYSGGAGTYNPSSYQYAPPPAAAASAYSNSFEDEPPLLEGRTWSRLLLSAQCFCIKHAHQQAAATHASSPASSARHKLKTRNSHP